MKLSAIITIPARLASQRLPNKMLLRDTGCALIEHTWRNASKVLNVTDLFVITDSDRIQQEVERFGGKAVMTSPDATSGSARIVEALPHLPHADIVVNLQGDEPEFSGRKKELKPITVTTYDSAYVNAEKLGNRFKLLIFDEVQVGMGRTGTLFAHEQENVTPDVMTLGKGFGNGFPVTAMLVSDKYKSHVERISASTSYGGNPMACAAALASLEVIQEENLCERAAELGDFIMARLKRMQDKYAIVGDVRGKGCLLGIELVKDKETKEPFLEAGAFVYKRAFENGVAWIPAWHILRMSPPLIMEKDVAGKALDIIEEAIAQAQKELL